MHGASYSTQVCYRLEVGIGVQADRKTLYSAVGESSPPQHYADCLNYPQPATLLQLVCLLPSLSISLTDSLIQPKLYVLAKHEHICSTYIAVPMYNAGVYICCACYMQHMNPTNVCA